MLTDLINLVQKSLDEGLRQCLTSLPINWQHSLRDRGLIKLLSDFAAITMIPALVLTSPRIAYHTVKYWWTSKLLRISMPWESLSDTSKSHALECHTLISNNIHEDEENANKNRLRRVLLFVHGGAWGSGQLWQYRDIAIQYGECLRMDNVLLLKYIYYPDAMILGQRDALLRSINYIHGEEFHQQLGLAFHDNISQVELIVCGHSSGAHLAVFSAVELLRQEKLKSANRILNTNFRPLIHSIIGLSGPFNLVKHFDFESGRGVQHISPMLGAAGGNIEGLAQCSPDIHLMTGHSVKEGDDDPPDDFSVKNTKIHLLHGTDDGTVPHEASERMEHALKRAGFRYVSGHYYPGHHLQPLLDVILHSRGPGNHTIRVLDGIRDEL